MYYVYLLLCSDRTIYIGATVNLNRRLRQHNSIIKGGAKYTKSKDGEWTRVLYLSGFPTWSEALKFEWKFQRLSRKLKLSKEIMDIYMGIYPTTSIPDTANEPNPLKKPKKPKKLTKKQIKQMKELEELKEYQTPTLAVPKHRLDEILLRRLKALKEIIDNNISTLTSLPFSTYETPLTIYFEDNDTKLMYDFINKIPIPTTPQPIKEIAELIA